MEQIFEVKKKSGAVKLPDGSKHEMKIPSRKQVKAALEKIEANEGGDVIEILAQFFVELGLKEEAMADFDYQDFQDLFAFLCGSKKN